MRWFRRILIAILIIFISPVIYVIDAIHRANFGVVVEGEAYRSGQMNAEQLAQVIRKYRIQSIINLRGTNTSEWYQDEVKLTAKLNVRHYDFALSANREVSVDEMDIIIKTLRAAPKPVLIHCKAGADRSGLVSALYELALEGQPPNLADRQLSIWYGHIPVAKTIAMDRSFWSYVSNSIAMAKPNARPVFISQ